MQAPGVLGLGLVAQLEGLPLCEECKVDSLVEDHRQGQLVCTRCGLVNEDTLISAEAEWRNFRDGDDGIDKSRVGATHGALTSSTALSTNIANIPGSVGSGMRRLQNAGTSAAEKAVSRAFEAVQRVGTRLELPDSIVQRAKEIAMRVREAGELRNRKPEALGAACIFMACKRVGASRTLREIEKFCSVDGKQIKKCLKVISAKGLYKGHNAPVNRNNIGSSGDQLIIRFCSRLKLSNEVANVAQHIASASKRLGILSGRKPATQAGASILFACELHPTERRSDAEVGRITSMAAATILGALRLLRPFSKSLLPPKGTTYVPDGAYPAEVKAKNEVQ